MANEERPRERVLSYGFASLSNAELLALFLRTGYQGVSVLEMANQILKQYSLKDLESLSINQLTKIKGISTSKAIELLGAFEISRRISRENCLNEDVSDAEDDLKDYLIKTIGHLKQENVLAVFLNKHNRIIGSKIIYVGTIDSSYFQPREIFREALQCFASRIVLAHNHPSGGKLPSQNDLIMTEKLLEAGRTMNIEVADHYIVTSTNAYSIRKNYYRL